MTHEEIIAMAKETIGDYSANDYWPFFTEDLQKFAALVAAKEREACALVCDELAELNRASPTDSMWQWGECAAAIRTRDLFEGAPA